MPPPHEWNSFLKYFLDVIYFVQTFKNMKYTVTFDPVLQCTMYISLYTFWKRNEANNQLFGMVKCQLFEFSHLGDVCLFVKTILVLGIILIFELASCHLSIPTITLHLRRSINTIYSERWRLSKKTAV